MDKRERLERTIAGEPTDRAPVALWRHYPGDDVRAADLAQSIAEDQTTFDWDIAGVMPGSTYQVIDYGIHEHWQGTATGEREITRHSVTRSLDWTELRSLDPMRGAHGRQIECIRLLGTMLADTPLLLTVYSPLAQAEMLAGRDLLVRHLRTQSDRLKSGLNVLTENLQRFIESLRKLPLAGICYVIQHADFDVLAEDEYAAVGLPYDRQVLTALPGRWWLNTIRAEGLAPMLRLLSSLPAQAMQWRDRDGEPDIALGKSFCMGAVCGGLSSIGDLYQGTPTSVRDAARESLQHVNQRRLILSTGSPMLLATPRSNIRALRAVVEPASV
ncbi:MAG: hypothetical protein IT320_01275 [Anaerolineae bacterium]|nr:hypothetical protein [Anaerolineae bacterium]